MKPNLWAGIRQNISLERQLKKLSKKFKKIERLYDACPNIQIVRKKRLEKIGMSVSNKMEKIGKLMQLEYK